MTADLLASLADSLITLAAGIYLLVARRSLVARIADSEKKARVDTLLRIGAPIMVVCTLLLAAGRIVSHEDGLARLARTANASLPKQIEPDLRLERISVARPRRLIYHFTALSGTVKDVDWNARRQQKIRMEEQIRSRADAQKLLRAGVTLVYRYSDRNAVLIDEIIIAPPLATKR